MVTSKQVRDWMELQKPRISRIFAAAEVQSNYSNRCINPPGPRPPPKV